jgi:prepilin-type N-terminal cleavage/methylation domain-containing protein
MSSTSPNRSRAGFTLMEILLAVAILSIVITAVYNTWSAALNAWRRGTDASEVMQRQRIVMDVLTELTQSAVFFTASAQLYTVVGTKNPGLGDSVSFVTASDAFLPPSEATDAGMRRVTISVEEDQYRRTYLAIVNQPALRPEDDSSAEPLQAHVVSMDVSGFFVRYLDPRDGTWSDKWEEPDIPPLAMEYTVVFGHQGDRLPPAVVTRAVDIPVATFIVGGNGLNSTNQVQRQDVDVSALTGNTTGTAAGNATAPPATP